MINIFYIAVVQEASLPPPPSIGLQPSTSLPRQAPALSTAGGGGGGGGGERNVAAAWAILQTPERVKGNDLTALEAFLNDELGILASEDMLELGGEDLLRIKDFLKPVGANLFVKALNL